jgi:hypothetical protein
LNWELSMHQTQTDAQMAAVDLAHYLTELFHPKDSGGAQLSSILGSYIFKAVLQEAGFAIVPTSSRPGMEKAFRKVIRFILICWVWNYDFHCRLMTAMGALSRNERAMWYLGCPGGV